MAMGAVVCRGRGGEQDGGTGWHGRLGMVAREGDRGEDELSAALGNEPRETGSGVGSAEFDDVEVAIELLPGVGEDASPCVGFVSSVFGAIGTCLALCDDTLGSFGDGKCAIAVVGIRRRSPRRRSCSGIGCKQSFSLFKSFSGRKEVFSQGFGLAIAGGEELGELGIGLGGHGTVWGWGGHVDERGRRRDGGMIVGRCGCGLGRDRHGELDSSLSGSWTSSERGRERGRTWRGVA